MKLGNVLEKFARLGTKVKYGGEPGMLKRQRTCSEFQKEIVFENEKRPQEEEEKFSKQKIKQQAFGAAGNDNWLARLERNVKIAKVENNFIENMYTEEEKTGSELANELCNIQIKSRLELDIRSRVEKGESCFKLKRKLEVVTM